MRSVERARPKNEAAELSALTALASTQRIDFYWTTLVAHLTNAIAATHEVPLSEALVYVIGVLAAEAMPAYQTMPTLCKDDRLTKADVLKDCRAVALAFERGDTDVTEMVGVTLAKRVWPADSVEWARASEARRIHEYRSALLVHSSFFTLPAARWAAKYLALCASNRREQDVEAGEIIDAGKPLIRRWIQPHKSCLPRRDSSSEMLTLGLEERLGTENCKLLLATLLPNRARVSMFRCSGELCVDLTDTIPPKPPEAWCSQRRKGRRYAKIRSERRCHPLAFGRWIGGGRYTPQLICRARRLDPHTVICGLFVGEAGVRTHQLGQRSGGECKMIAADAHFTRLARPWSRNGTKPRQRGGCPHR